MSSGALIASLLRPVNRLRSAGCLI